jgi:hypothetical protein
MNKATAATPANAGRSALSAGLLIGFGIGGFLGYLLAPSEVHVLPPSPAYYSGPVYVPPPACRAEVVAF